MPSFDYCTFRVPINLMIRYDYILYLIMIHMPACLFVFVYSIMMKRLKPEKDRCF